VIGYVYWMITTSFPSLSRPANYWVANIKSKYQCTISFITLFTDEWYSGHKGWNTMGACKNRIQSTQSKIISHVLWLVYSDMLTNHRTCVIFRLGIDWIRYLHAPDMNKVVCSIERNKGTICYVHDWTRFEIYFHVPKKN